MAFELGWDYVRYGLASEDLFREDDDFNAGFRAGCSQGPRRQTRDRYIHKRLQLRCSAYSRGVDFSPAVTPSYLQAIDRPACPVTRKAMSRNTLTSTDAAFAAQRHAQSHPQRLCAGDTECRPLARDADVQLHRVTLARLGRSQLRLGGSPLCLRGFELRRTLFGSLGFLQRGHRFQPGLGSP